MTLALVLLLVSFTINVIAAVGIVIVLLRPRPSTKRTATRLPKLEDIYNLIDPVDGRLRYVGRSDDVRRRINQHIRLAFTYGGLITWIHELYMQGLQPRVKVVASKLPSKDARVAESQNIEELVRAGEKLFNKQLINPAYEMTRRILIEMPEPQKE